MIRSEEIHGQGMRHRAVRFVVVKGVSKLPSVWDADSQRVMSVVVS